jgi:hypothetical protein
VGVITGMDPHKRSATIEVIDEAGRVLESGRFGTDTDGYAQLLAAGRKHTDRIWAVAQVWRTRRGRFANGSCKRFANGRCRRAAYGARWADRARRGKRRSEVQLSDGGVHACTGLV